MYSPILFFFTYTLFLLYNKLIHYIFLNCYANNKNTFDVHDDICNNDELIENGNITLLGIIGKKGSGKDTIGSVLEKYYGFVRIGFADSLKDACRSIFGFSDKQLYDDKYKEIIDEYWGHSPREIFQKVGTELFRDELPKICTNISNDIWIRCVERKIIELRKLGHTRFVITDVRFSNEHNFVKSYGGTIWKVVRDNIVHNDPHSSELIIDNLQYDMEVNNNDTIEKLSVVVHNNIKHLL